MELQKFDSFNGIDSEKFKDLIESGFGRRLVDWYFDYANPEYICLAVGEDGNYMGAIVVEKIPGLDKVHYLDKIVVGSQHQKQGIGKLLWAALNGHSEKAVWRAKKDNPFNDFYEGQCDGKLSFPELPSYFVYYYGLNPGELEKAIDYAAGKKATLV